MLIEAGADVNKAKNNGMTPLSISDSNCAGTDRAGLIIQLSISMMLRNANLSRDERKQLCTKYEADL